MSAEEISISDASTEVLKETVSYSSSQPTCGHRCGYALNINSCCRNAGNSKWFDMDAATEFVKQSFSMPISNACHPGSNYWICASCRRATTDQKRSVTKINDRKFFICNKCFEQQRMQRIWGMIFRQIQFHLCFTMVWIPSPDGAFLGTKINRHAEFAGLVVVLVFTLLFQIAAFVNVIAVRPLCDLLHTQRKRPAIDLYIEVVCAVFWVAIIVAMVHDGIRQYSHQGWDGRLIALLICACVILITFLFTSLVAFKTLMETKVTMIEGAPDPFGEKPKFSLVRAIAYLS